MKIGDRVEVNLPGHWLRGSFGSVNSQGARGSWWVAVDGCIECKWFLEKDLILQNHPEPNPANFETATGALR